MTRAGRHGVHAGELLQNGDAALYWAKRTGRGRTVRCVPGHVVPEAQQRDEIATLLERGTSALRTMFQPVVELATARPARYEALTRFESSPPRGPDEWFAQAHRVGLGEKLEALALRGGAGRPRPPRRDLPAGQRLATGAAERARAGRAARGPDRDRRRADRARAVRRRGRAGERLASLRARGARVALDDAGAGYAELQQIIRIAPES